VHTEFVSHGLHANGMIRVCESVLDNRLTSGGGIWSQHVQDVLTRPVALSGCERPSYSLARVVQMPEYQGIGASLSVDRARA